MIIYEIRKDTPMRHILHFIYGIVYATSMLIPGFSGGTALVIFGCYDIVCEAFALNFKKIKQNIVFLLVFGAGVICGLIGFVYVITFLLDNYVIQTNMFLLGLIFGGLPLILRLATEEEKLKPLCLIPFLAGLGFIIGLFVLERAGIFGGADSQTFDFVYVLRMLLSSFLAAVALVLPGISGAFVFVALGVYEQVTNALKELDFKVIIPVVIGAVLGLVLGSRMVLFLLGKNKLIVYSVIVGMVIGSLAPLFPEGFGMNLATLGGVLCFAVGFTAAVFLGKQGPAETHSKSMEKE